ncbi:MAG: lyase [Nitrospirae bacterium]|nr:lyase [Nitrospirota bacterium]
MLIMDFLKGIGWIFFLILISLPHIAHGAKCGPAYGADGIAVDSKGDVWMTHYEDVRVGKLEVFGEKFTEFLPSTKSNLEVTTRKGGSSKEGFDYSFDTGFSGIVIDEKNGFLLTGKWNSNKLVRFSLKDKSFKEFTLPAKYTFGMRWQIEMDSKGNLWILAVDIDNLLKMPKNGKIIRVSQEGKFKVIPFPIKEFIGTGMTIDPQGRTWLALTPIEKGKDAELYALIKGRWQRQKLSEVGRYITGMTFDSKGNLWFAAPEKNAIGKLAGVRGKNEVTLYPVPTPEALPNQLAIDSKDNVWFIEWSGNKMGRLSPGGQIREYSIPPEEEKPVTLAFDRDGNIWFSTLMNYNLFRLDPETGAIKEYTVPVPSNWSEDAAAASSVCAVKSKDVKGEEIKADPLTPIRHAKGFSDDPNAILFEKSCNTQCHTWYRVDKVANRRSDWTPTVDRMIEANGAKFITEADRGEIIRYLNENYTMRKEAAEAR